MSAHHLDPVLQEAARHYQELMQISNTAAAVLALAYIILRALLAWQG